MSLAKAQLQYSCLVPPHWGTIECQFNPESLGISKSVTWNGEANPSWNSPYPMFGGGEGATYSLELFFDSYSQKDFKDVRYYTNQLLRLTLRGRGYAMFLLPFSSPPTVKFIWGKMRLFNAVVEKLDITYTLFLEDGTPIRAKANLDLKQCDFWDDVLPAQNPTSRTDPRRTRIATSHMRLDQIAYEEYGDSRYWRLLAEANNLDDPFALQDGQILIIPENTF
jgi:hypothetical protein